jgi:8-oxo-dGTP pyrophosphatase MutT (NUDIX family)
MPSHPDDPTRISVSATPPPVLELLGRVAEERGLNFEPPPAEVIDALPGLTETVENLAGRCRDVQERRWLAAALAALSHHVQAGALAELTSDPHRDGEPAASPVAPDADRVAIAVVTSRLGVLAGRQRDGIPRWVLPGGVIENGETAECAAVRECAEETGLAVVADHEIGSRTHPVTGQLLIYVACTPTKGSHAWAANSEELIKVRWLDSTRLAELMPDLFDLVREYIDNRPHR